MRIIIYVVYSTLNYAIELLTLAMAVRALLSWFFPMASRSSRFVQVLVSVTEIFISPVRRFMMRFAFVRTFPLDLAYLVTYLLLHVAQTVIYSVGTALMDLFII